jgi:hypothetical protein
MSLLVLRLILIFAWAFLGVYLRRFCLTIEGALQAMKLKSARQRRRRQTEKL